MATRPVEGEINGVKDGVVRVLSMHKPRSNASPGASKRQKCASAKEKSVSGLPANSRFLIAGDGRRGVQDAKWLSS